MEKLSAEVLKLKREKEIAVSAKPFIEQALKEFPDAMEQIGVKPLPLVVVKNPGFFSDEKPMKCMWGYYLIAVFSEYKLFLTSDGKYHAGITTYSSDRKVTDKNKTRVYFKLPRITKPFGKYDIDPATVVHEEVISKDEAVSLIAENLTINTGYSVESGKAIADALNRNDYETAVAILFSGYITHNAAYNNKLMEDRDKLDFLRRMNRK